MAVNSNISWTNSTWNPHMGCRKVSEACKYCYMHRILDKNGTDPKQVFRNNQEFDRPLKWSSGKKIFTCSMSDFFIEEADEWRDELWEIIKKTKQHTYLILTKRPERIKENLPKDWSKKNYPNVWLGITIENQKTLDRIHYLENIECSVKWVSFEPLLGEVYLSDREISIIDWAVLGGESGYETGKYRYRKTELSWFLSLMYQFRSSGIPIFFKQFGTWYYKNKYMLKDWKGEKWCSNFPDSFKLRQYPNPKKTAQ